MLTRNDEAARGATRTASEPKSHPGPTAKKATGVSHSGTERRKSRVLASRRGRDVVTDTICWAIFTAVIAIIILSSCALTWLVWPVAP